MLFLSLWVASPAHASSVDLRVANPVAVELPSTVRSIGIGHRNLPADPEKHPGIAAEATHTQEVPDGDFLAADLAVQAAADLIAASERFDVVQLGAVEMADRRGRFAEPLQPEQVAAFCEGHEVQALLMLEGLDSDVEEEGKETVRAGSPVFEARQLIEGRVLWRTYQCEGASVVDEDLIEADRLRFEDSSAAIDPAVAWSALPSAATKMETLGQMAGQLEARRLAPSWAKVTRTWMPSGSDGLKAAAAHLKTDDWAAAVKAWSDAYDTDQGKAKGKAAFNLAVAAERSGELELARRWLDAAWVDWSSGAVTKYQALLERRARSNDTVARAESRAISTERPVTPASELPLAIPAHKPNDAPAP